MRGRESVRRHNSASPVGAILIAVFTRLFCRYLLFLLVIIRRVYAGGGAGLDFSATSWTLSFFSMRFGTQPTVQRENSFLISSRTLAYTLIGLTNSEHRLIATLHQCYNFSLNNRNVTHVVYNSSHYYCSLLLLRMMIVATVTIFLAGFSIRYWLFIYCGKYLL